MKDYAIPISLVGAALIIVGGLAYLISPDTGSTGLVNAAVGLLLVVSAGFITQIYFGSTVASSMRFGEVSWSLALWQ